MTQSPTATSADQESARLTELVTYARANSPYYSQLYKDIPEQGWKLSELPIIDGSSFWQGSQDVSTWPVLTGKFSDGLIFKTGGTTGASKLSVFSRAEWKSLTTSFSRSIGNHVKPGDRVANLFYCGDLYSSFMLVHDSMMNMEVPVCEYPFGGSIESAKLIDQLIALDVNVLLGPPSMILGHAAYLEKMNLQLPKVELLLFGCESIFASQMALLKKVMPNMKVASIGYACVDAGIVGACDQTCASGEHKVFSPETIVEIIDEQTGQPITEPGEVGLLVVTALERRLMPVIRYPVGDRAAWVNDSNGTEQKFVLKGRSSIGQRIRVGLASMYPDEFDNIITDIIDKHRWQLMLRHIDSCDHVVLRIARNGSDDEAQRIIDALFKKDWALRELRDRKQLKLLVEWCGQEELAINPRTGKLLRVIDHRNYDLDEVAK